MKYARSRVDTSSIIQTSCMIPSARNACVTRLPHLTRAGAGQHARFQRFRAATKKAQLPPPKPGHFRCAFSCCPLPRSHLAPPQVLAGERVIRRTHREQYKYPIPVSTTQPLAFAPLLLFPPSTAERSLFPDPVCCTPTDQQPTTAHHPQPIPSFSFTYYYNSF